MIPHAGPGPENLLPVDYCLLLVLDSSNYKGQFLQMQIKRNNAVKNVSTPAAGLGGKSGPSSADLEFPM